MRDRFVATVALSTLVVLVAVAPLAGVASADVTEPRAAASVAAEPVAPGAAGLTGPTTDGVASLQQQCTEGEASYPLEVEDNTSATVTIEEAPETVVTLGPSAAQTVWELGADDKVVGVTQFAAYLEGAGEKTNVSTSQFAVYDAEAIVAADPDVVLAPNIVFESEVTRLREAGLTVYKFDPATSIEDIQRKTLLTGALVDDCEAARETNRWVRQNLDAVTGAVESREPVRALYVSFGQTTGGDTFTHSMIEASGATNVVNEAGQTGYVFPVNQELVAEQDPEWLVLTNPNSRVPEQAPYNQTTAGEEGNVVVVSSNWLNQPAPRSVVFAVRNMTEAFHGDVYGPESYVSREEAARTPTPTTTTGTTTTDTTDSTTAEPTTADDGQAQPGFGAVVAVVAVLGALALLRRRD
ncbi:corrinoid ABC transporter substrate-binding protein [Halobacteriales archaeon SW_5_70_135]|nr:MAG: corrinoid ABC transporter substrate-binding protein [Halobacteriales archaeon SW_5_70_135]